MDTKCAILQSNYIPWRGYFDIINDVDLFVFYDEVQFTVRDWRHRNIIYTTSGLKWISLPCGSDLTRRVDEVKIAADMNWQEQHYRKICDAYKKAPYFSKYKSFLEHVYLERKWEYLSEFNQFLIKHIAQDFLKAKADFVNSCEYNSEGRRNEKLLSLMLSIGYKNYLCGPAAKAYLDEEAFLDNGINILWKDYSGYPDYPQTQQPFEGRVSIIDLLVNTGEDAPYYIWGWRDEAKKADIL